MKDMLVKIARGNWHRNDGLYTKALFSIDEEFFIELKKECIRLAQSQAASIVAEDSHITNWTGPFGEAVQFSLFNTSGDFNDTSTDHVLSVEGKSFKHSKEYPIINQFISAFPGLRNMRLNGMGERSGLSPHEEHIVYKDINGNRVVRARFHLPIASNENVEMLIGDRLYRYKEGIIYFFNNGAVHSANNKGSEFRFHLVFDILMTEKAAGMMFGDAVRPDWLQKINIQDEVISSYKYKTFHTYGGPQQIHSKLKLNGVLSLQKFAVLYNWLSSVMLTHKVPYAEE